MGLKRVIAISGTALLIGAALPGTPAAAKRGGKCPRMQPVPPSHESVRDEDIAQQPVIRVTDSATEDEPVVVEFDQEASVWWYAHSQGRGPIVDGNRYFNVQVFTEKKVAGLHVRLEWLVAPAELDLYMYYEDGSMAAWSEAFNQVPAGTSPGEPGGLGFEYIPGFPVARCMGFVIEDNAMWTTPQPAQLKLWLGPMEWSG